MKGEIACCLRDLVVEKFGKEQWEASLVGAGLPKNQAFMSILDFEDAVVMKVVHSVCSTLGITYEQAADAFGDYWVNVYSQKMYAPLYKKHANARSFLLAMDELHVNVTNTMPNAHPPRFEFEWKGDKNLVMHYHSKRGLPEFLVGLAKGVGNYYHEPLKVSKLAPDQVEIVFQ